LARVCAHPVQIVLDRNEFQRRDLVDVDQPARTQEPNAIIGTGPPAMSFAASPR
jgi:hypothetical protein